MYSLRCLNFFAQITPKRQKLDAVKDEYNALPDLAKRDNFIPTTEIQKQDREKALKLYEELGSLNQNVESWLEAHRDCYAGPSL